MYRENSIHSFRLGMLVSSLLLFAIPILAQGPKAPLQASASLRANAAEGNEAIGESRLETLLQAQLRTQHLEIELLKDRVRTLEAMVGTLKAGKPEQPTTAAVGTTAAPDSAKTGAELRAEAGAAGPTPKPGGHSAFEPQRELLPDIGQIGAEFGLLTGGSTNPFEAAKGGFFAGFIDLPLKKFPAGGGKWSYEIMVGLQRNVTQDRPVTSGVFAVVNSALNFALGNRPGGLSSLTSPLPITINTEQRMKVLTVVPFSLKYTVTKFDSHRFRPYGVVGWGTYVTISSQNTKGFDANNFIANPTVAGVVNSLLNGSLIGGQLPEAAELRARGIANGQGDIRFGVNFGGGFEYRLVHKFSIGVDYRGNKIEGKNGFFSTFAAKETFHF